VEAGGRFSGLWADAKDNRSKRIEIIRKTNDAPVSELTAQQICKIDLHDIKKGIKKVKNKATTSQVGSQRTLELEPLKRSISQLKKLPKELAPELNRGHTLKSINDQVIRRFADRPSKLKMHLPYISFTPYRPQTLTNEQQ
jgi:hypothetical protein